jgi:L-arabinokinase
VTGIFYYVSGHGYGHAVRSAQVIAAIVRQAPEMPVWVRTSAPAWLFPTDVYVETVQLDLGVLQRGSLHVRPHDTLRAYAELMDREEDQILTEIGIARAREVSCVVADIPSAAFEIARRLDLPGIGIANFCWHWIYEPYARRFPELRHVVEHIRHQEGLGTTLLRLPFAWDFTCFPRKLDVPLVGRPAVSSAYETRRLLGIDQDRRVALLSFGGHGLNALGEERLHQWNDWLFLTTDRGRPAGRSRNVHNIASAHVSYVDLMGACDAVVTKPGFGIVSDALVNRVPVLYSDRGQFREYAVLSRALRSFGRAKYIPRRALLDGELGPYLDDLMEIDRPWTPIDTSGAEVIARHILQAAGS